MDFSIKPSKLYSLVYQDSYFIDLRDNYSFSKLHILNFINISQEQLPFFINLLSKDKPIYLICYSGEKAKEICLKLRDKGYQAFYIEGGFQAFLDQHDYTSLY